MSALTWIVLIAAAVIVYYTVRRWAVLDIFASLVAGTLANQLRAKYVEELMARRDRLDVESKEYQQVEDFIAELDPMCVRGRQDLLDAAWEIHHQCRWTKPKLSVN
jgi:hypothetical protein